MNHVDNVRLHHLKRFYGLFPRLEQCLGGLSNLTSGLLNLCRSVILAFPFNVRFVSTGPFVVYFDEDGADQAFE